MNTTTAKCGHPTPAIGAPGSAARAACESAKCRACALQWWASLSINEMKELTNKYRPWLYWHSVSDSSIHEIHTREGNP